MRSTKLIGIAMVATAFVVVAAMSMFSVNTGFASNLNSSLPFFAQKSNGQGQSGENPSKAPGTGNNGQGQGQENGNPPENPGNGNNNQGNGNPPENPGNGNNGQSQENGNPPADPGNSEAEPEDDAGDDVGDAEAAADAPPAKVNVCHVTESGNTVMINISERAVPAHEGHGDTQIDVASEDECVDAEEPEAPGATPVPDEGDNDGEGEDDGDDDGDEAPPVDPGTPIASPVASPVI